MSANVDHTLALTLPLVSPKELPSLYLFIILLLPPFIINQLSLNSTHF